MASIKTFLGKLTVNTTQARNRLTRIGINPPNQIQRYQQFSTYYDSQSGLHLPVHNEQEIRLFLNVNGQENGKPFISNQLYKNSNEGSEMEDKLMSLTQKGIRGIILPPSQFIRDCRNLKALSTIAPEDFFILYSHPSNPQDMQAEKSEMENVSLILNYEEQEQENEKNGLKEALEYSVEKGKHTTLSITENVYMSDIEAIRLVNNIATMIDSVGGCDFIWLSSKSEDSADTVVEVCEELVYLDVAGPTIKSRLIGDSLNEDVLEDMMFAGVNKYVIDNESQIEIIESVASEQGKAMVKQSK